MATGKDKDSGSDSGTDTVELPSTDGVPFVGLSSPLTRLHYFDGQYLRARLLTQEQEYHRNALRLANLAGGWGVVHGLGVSREADELVVGEGLAVTPAGSFVLAAEVLRAKIGKLLEVAAPAPLAGHKDFADCLEPVQGGTAATPGTKFYEITVGPIEGLCGNEPVYGKLCDTACASDSRHPYWREGVVLRLRPLVLALPTSTEVAASAVHLRNRMASAYFAAEPWLRQSLLSAAGLASDLWCRPAQLYERDEVVIGLLAREGLTVRVLDAWAGRRERMDTQARGYWQGRMGMRPWNVFLAQVLQFQCQLAGLFDPKKPVILPQEDCDELRELLAKARKEIETLLKRYGTGAKKLIGKVDVRPTLTEYRNVASHVEASFADLDGLSAQLATVGTGQGALPQERMLLKAGFFELPPAGYLPVAQDADVEEQLRRMFGEGVSLHFHAVAGDEIGALVEQAQHMKRISLTRGLDDPRQREPVEVFVPDGEVRDAQSPQAGTWWRTRVLATAVRALVSLASGTQWKTQQRPLPESTAAPKAPQAVASDTQVPKEAQATERTKSWASGFARSNLAFGATGSVKLASDLDGLLRSEAREDGTFGFTLVASNDWLQPQEGQAMEAIVAARDLKQGMTAEAYRQAYEELRKRLGAGGGVPGFGIGLYAQADLQKDPFALAIGDSARVLGEGRLVVAGYGMEAAGELALDATLTVLDRSVASSGVEERLVQVDLRMVLTGADGSSNGRSARGRMVLRRDGDARSGVVMVDDDPADPGNEEMCFAWDDAPRRAVLFVQAPGEEAAEKAVVRKFVRLGKELQAGEQVQVEASGQVEQQAVAGRTNLAEMTALPGMPAIDSSIGTASMNTLAAIADVADDAAFLLRSRRRLFPALDTGRLQRVTARHDWVMFRRARTHLLAPPAAAAPAPATETFQVWHLKADSPKAVESIEHALDQGDAGTLARFRFQRVGLLRYRDESAFSEETPDRVLAMWQARQPGPVVALARAWELAPQAGQGWQNHMRLRNMLEQAKSLMQPPPRGTGVIGTVAPPPGELGDKAYDGGMLVVTVAAPTPTPTPTPAPVTVKHRVVMLDLTNFNRVLEALPDPQLSNEDWGQFSAIVKNASPKQDFVLDFVDGKLPQAAVDQIKTADAAMRAGKPDDYLARKLLRLDQHTVAANVHPEEQHKAILAVLVGAVDHDAGHKGTPETDLGGGAAVVTVLGYDMMYY